MTLFKRYTIDSVIINGLMLPFPYLDIVWLKACPSFINITYLMLMKVVGATVSWVIIWLATPTRGHGEKDTFIFAPLNNLIRARPKFYGTIIRLLAFPSHFKLFILGITPISYADWIKTTLLASVFSIPLAVMN
jgi:hypothetical protein